MIKFKLFFYSVLGISFLFFTGCSFLTPVKLETINTYLLNSLPHVTKRSVHPVTLLVLPVETLSVYNTKQMAYTTKPYQIAYFAQNQWADTPAQMLQALLVQTLQNTHYFRAVIAAPNGGRYTYSLDTKLLKLEQDYTRYPVMRIVVNAQIVRILTNQVIATKQFTIAIPLTDRTPYAGVIAANKGTMILLRQMAEFCLREIK